MTKTLLSSAVPTTSQLLTGWRPALLLTLGLLPALPTTAQQRPQQLLKQGRQLKSAELATRATRLVAAPTQPTSLVAARAVRRGVLAAVSSTATGGNWSDATTWVGGAVPTATNEVTIVSGATVMLDVAASAASLTVATGGSLLNSPTTAYSLAVGGNVVNNGVLDLSASATIGSDLRFTGAGNASFNGSGATDLQSVSLAKAAQTDVVEMNLPSLSVKGSTTSGDGFLLTRTTAGTPADDMTGTFKISGTATISNKVFGNAAAYTIPSTGGFWLNNPNFTVVAQTGTATASGLVRLSAGTYNIGTAAGNSLLLSTGSSLTVEGGSLTAAGRVTSYTSATATATTTFTLSGGTINVANVGNTGSAPSFGINGTSTVSGGTINLVQRSTAGTPLDYLVAGAYRFSGGTVNVGTAETATNFDFRIRGNLPNLTVDNTTNPKSAVLTARGDVLGSILINPGAGLTINGQTLLVYGSALTNNGTLTASATVSTLYFAGSAPQTLGGTGTFTPIRTLSLDNDGGGVTLNAPVVAYRVNMFTGDLNGTTNLTVGDATPTVFVIQIGVGSNTGSSGSFTAAPKFNIGNGALQLVYAPETTNRTTGFEVPANRLVDVVSIANPAGVTVAGGPLLIPGLSTVALVLTNGILTSSDANPVVIGAGTTGIPTGAAASYVNGPLGIIVNSTTAVSRTFAVGDAAGWRPVVVSGITATDELFVATVVEGATGGALSGGLSGLNPTRYVRLENSAALPATARVQLSYGTDDVLGDPATAVVAQAATAGGSYASLGGAPATVPTTGIVSTQDLTPGNDFFALANTEGGVLTSSVAAVCAGANTGTITLTGNTGTVTGYEANSGSGFVAVAGTNTGTTYTFTNLAVTTTFRAVLTTADGRTVYSAPVTVTVNPATTATFTYASATFCQSGTNPTPTITGTAGGTFSSTTGLSIDAATGVINLAASTAGTYVVTYNVAGTCASSATFSVTITAPATAGFSYASATYCTSTAGAVAPTLATGASAGVFSSTTGLTIDATTGAITPGTSTPGTYVVTNTVAASGGCSEVAATFSVTITAPATTGFSYASANYCVGAANPSPVLATGATAGTFSSTTGLVIDATTGVINLTTSTAGTYVVTNTVAAAGACAAVSATFSVTINARPAQPTVTVQYNGAVTTLTSSATTGNQWYLNGTAIAGATNPTYVVNSAAQLGSYTVTTTSTAGCTSLPSAPLVVTSGTKALAGSSLQLYPNPTTNGLLTVKLGGYSKAVELTVYNSVGQQVRTLAVPAGRLEQSLDLSQLPSGVYVLKARTEGGLDVRRIVKE